MTSNATSTTRQAAKGPASVGSAVKIERASQLVDEAEATLGRYLVAGRWPNARVARKFRESDDLQIVLSLYTRAMEDDPGEPAYPWNLASALDRLRLPDLALVYIRRAIRIAEQAGDREWSGTGVYLACADIALRAGEPEVAEWAIAKAREIDPGAPVERYLRLLRRSLRTDGAEETRPADAARKGTAVEYLIAANCMLSSNFELNVSTNLVDDEGVDLVFHRRDGLATLAVQIKSRSWSASMMRNRERFVANVRRATFRQREGFYLLFVAVDTRLADYGPVWLVPSTEFAQAVGRRHGERLRFVASASPASVDQWSGYRLERSRLPRRILDELAILEG